MDSDSKYLIITHSLKGHYQYYIDILNRNLRGVLVHNLEESDIKIIHPKLKKESLNIIVLNGDYLLKNKLLFIIKIIFNKVHCKAIYYNVDFLYVTSFRTILIRLYFYLCKYIFKNIKNITIIDHPNNEKYGLYFSTDPIEEIDHTDEILKNDQEEYLLLFGNHSKRKGTYDFLRSYTGQYKLLIVGRIHDQRILEDFSEHPKVSISNNFVTDEEKHSLFSGASAVILPYKNWVGSSGVLGHAIAYNKIVFGYSGNHMGKVIEKYNKGAFLEFDTNNITKEMLYSLENNDSNFNEILEKYYSVDKFINVISN